MQLVEPRRRPMPRPAGGEQVGGQVGIGERHSTPGVDQVRQGGEGGGVGSGSGAAGGVEEVAVGVGQRFEIPGSFDDGPRPGEADRRSGDQQETVESELPQQTLDFGRPFGMGRDPAFRRQLPESGPAESPLQAIASAAVEVGEREVEREPLPRPLPAAVAGAQVVDPSTALLEHPAGRFLESPLRVAPAPNRPDPSVLRRTRERLAGGSLGEAESLEGLDEGAGPHRPSRRPDELAEDRQQQGTRARRVSAPVVGVAVHRFSGHRSE